VKRIQRLRIASHVLLGLALLLLGIVPQAISHAAKKSTVAEAKPSLDVVMVMDTGSRNYGATIQTAQRALAQYMKSFPNGVRFGLVTFSGPATEVQGLTSSKEKVLRALSLQATEQPDSNLFDGLDLASQTFNLGYSVKRQIVVATDGFDSASIKKLSDLTTDLAKTGVRVDVLEYDSIEKNPSVTDALTTRTSGSKLRVTDTQGMRLLADRTVAWATPPAPPTPPKLSAITNIFSSSLVLYLGAALVFAGLVVVLLMFSAPKPKKISLTSAIGNVEAPKATSTMGGLADRLANVAEHALEKSAKKSKKKGGGLNVLLERAAISLRPGEFVVIAIAAGFVTMAIGFLAFKPWGAPIGFFLGALILPKKFLKRKIKKRSAAFGEQLSDTLQLLSSSLRAGQGLMQAVDSVAREGDAPAAEEFRRVVVEARLGRDLIDSLKSMSDRLQSEDFQWVIPAIEINREVGGDLAEVLDTVASTVRDRADIRRQVKTLSAEGRMSAYVLLALPIGIAILVRASNPTYINQLFTGFGWVLTGIGVALMTIGGFWMFSLCKIEF
jgi:tight adherence protein B